MTMHPHSLTTYTDDILPFLTAKEAEVLRAITYLNRATMHEVAAHMGVETHTISGRFGSLRDKGRIEEASIDRTTGRPRTRWKIRGNPETLRLI